MSLPNKSKKYSGINDVRVLQAKGPWPTKSKGNLQVLSAIPWQLLQDKFFKYDEDELRSVGEDIRGLREYIVTDLQTGVVGAMEWHKLRNELVFCVRGKLRWTCEDVSGKKVDYILGQQDGLWVPPFILHTYEALSDNTEILVVANTLFLVDRPSSHDTYTSDAFRELQRHH